MHTQKPSPLLCSKILFISLYCPNQSLVSLTAFNIQHCKMVHEAFVSILHVCEFVRGCVWACMVSLKVELDGCKLPLTPNLILRREAGDKYFKVILFALCCLVPGALTIIGIYACLTRDFRTELHCLLYSLPIGASQEMKDNWQRLCSGHTEPCVFMCLNKH